MNAKKSKQAWDYKLYLKIKHFDQNWKTKFINYIETSISYRWNSDEKTKEQMNVFINEIKKN